MEKGLAFSCSLFVSLFVLDASSCSFLGMLPFPRTAGHMGHWSREHPRKKRLHCVALLGLAASFNEYSILLMSELSTVWYDRALGRWIAGTRASYVDGELPWRCCGRWTMRWTAVKGSRDRSSCRAVAVASTPESKAQAATEDGFLGLRHKTKKADGG